MLGVTQRQIENDYYMVDIPKFLRSKTKSNSIERLSMISTLIGTEGRSMEDRDYQRMLKDLRKQAGYVDREEFDRDKFEQLRNFFK
ncbi:hypothetical protein QPL77_14420 [Bacillus pumilus]|uniref:hypothetical protein n=1 Tax=Bacillus pumilus TaxID=1408 RepID=UPI0015D530B0|nr:hypothetical protein [Bacillus pumilus]QLI77170.1 hypothetical protein HZ310_04815 [Bacillus pumilus]WIG31170.1 hypothetical protein QPL77_14420 [Bacillus pumilus]